jgi:hypothetical protein
MSVRRPAERHDRSGQWYLLTGLLLGIGLGLLVAWALLPVRYVDTAPDSLRADYKDAYRGLIASAYAVDGNLPRAATRLALLGDDNPAQALAEQAQQLAASGDASQLVGYLGRLSADLTTGSASLLTPITTDPGGDVTPSLMATLPNEAAVKTATARPTATRTPMATFTPRPTKAVQATLGAPFKVDISEGLCGEGVAPGLIVVAVVDSDGQPVFGQRVIITWAGGEEVFYTGLHPDEDDGYADYLMTAGVTYALRVGDGGQIVGDITIPDCDGTPGGWRVYFFQY